VSPRSASDTAPADERDDRGNQTVSAIERASDVLLYFSKTTSPDLGITDISRELGLSKAAVHRVLASLRSRDLVALDETTRRYSLGAATIMLGLSALGRINVRTLAVPELSLLAALTNETATLSVRSGSVRIYVDQVTPPREVIMSVSIGTPYPLHAGSSSKAFLAFLGQDAIDRHLSEPLDPVTVGTQTDRRQLLRELAAIRERGWAESVGERQEGAASVAAPVFDHLRRPVAVLSVCGPEARFRSAFEACAGHLLDATARLSKQLGSTRPD
jgi:IclR family acetate operon transcriptional repressor